jgi:DNA replication licensing factor MCM4
VVENIRLPPTILSRFDLIYLVLDKQSVVGDRRLASHIVSLYGENDSMDIDNRDERNVNTTLNREFLSKYISYSRKFISP